MYYPHGERPDGGDWTQTGPIFQYLQSQGFRVFCSVGIESCPFCCLWMKVSPNPHQSQAGRGPGYLSRHRTGDTVSGSCGAKVEKEVALSINARSELDWLVFNAPLGDLLYEISLHSLTARASERNKCPGQKNKKRAERRSIRCCCIQFHRILAYRYVRYF